MAISDGLVGHWLLAEDSKDASAGGHEGRGRGVAFAGAEGARFDGRESVIEVADRPALRFGAGDFSLSVWVHTEKELDDALGDIVSKYDPGARRGFQLGLQSFAGVTSAQSNDRNLQFGVDSGADPAWTDCGRPGNSVYVCALCVHAGALYAGTFETGAEEAGHVYRYDGAAGWIDCGAPDRCNAVSSLAEFDGQLYAGVSHYRAVGSSLPESPNHHPGGRIYRYEGGTRWTECGRLGGPGSTAARATYGDNMARFVGWSPEQVDTVHGLAAYGGRLYALPLYHQGVYRYEGGTTWSDCGSPGVRMMALGVFHGHLYGAGNESAGTGGVYRYDGGRQWTRTGDQAGVTQVYSFAAYDGKLHVGTWPEAAVFRDDGEQAWTHAGRLGDEKEVMGMMVYNGKLYAGTLPLAEVYRYDGGSAWTRTGRLDHTPDVTYRRAWSMAVCGGKLFCGTLPSGHVHAMEAGQVVSHDHALAPGWRHVAAVREGGRLSLYVDGARVATHAFNGAALDVSNDRPLLIGRGPHDYFNGRLRDLRLYGRALADAEIASLGNP